MARTARSGRKKPGNTRSRSRSTATRSRARSGSTARTGGTKKKASAGARKKTVPARKKAGRAATKARAAASKRVSPKKASTARAKKKLATRSGAVKPLRKKAASPKKSVGGGAAAIAGSAAARNNGSRGDARRIREALLARRAETLSLLERSSDYGKQRLREDAEDLVDQATDSQARDVVYALNSAEGDMIRLIDGALQRLESGEYGICVSCGEPIQRRRLEAVPWATLCVACQELQEQGVLQAE